MSGATGRAVPQPTQISSWQRAEHNAARWMRYWGYADATARPGGPDAGVDVRARGALGQVKYQAAQVGRPELQRFVGARPRGSTAQLIFFTGSDYTQSALTYAAEWDIALFRYGLDGAMTPANDVARRVQRRAVAQPAAPAPAARPSVPVRASAPPERPFWQRALRVWFGVTLLLAPLGSLGDEKTYTGPPALDAVKFVGILTGCWLVGGYLLATRKGPRRKPGEAAPSRPSSSSAPSPPSTPSVLAALTAPLPADLVAEAARMLSSGRKPHEVDRVLRERGVRFLERGRILNEAKRPTPRT
ncbi:restriction endonuclease [Streptomyces griseosporeus]|uniref:restriction endonuclease n=1 Tax=Streptomyces griseosporeus TaxID=1910 RepID=UPI0036F7DB28